MLRENGAVSHEVWDTTDPANPTLVSTPVSGLDVTHRNWWDCKTGIAYIVGGATKKTDRQLRRLEHMPAARIST